VDFFTNCMASYGSLRGAPWKGSHAARDFNPE
jgi:hypothetical protein